MGDAESVLTEGAWKLHENGESNWILTGGDYPDEPDLYAEITTASPADARALANAKRLFESLEAVVKAWLHEAGQGDGIMEEHAPILAKARAVIAEVKGEAP